MNKGKSFYLLLIAIVVIVGLLVSAGYTVYKLRLFSKYSYCPGTNWLPGLEKEMCKWYGRPRDTVGVTLINFDWGYYKVHICSPFPGEKFDPEQHGYIGFRAYSKQGNIQQESNYPSYIIDPKGNVWKNRNVDEIPEMGPITTLPDGTKRGSSGEAIVHHFKTNKEDWQKYGRISKSNNEYTLIKE